MGSISGGNVYTQLIHNCELAGIAGQATAPALIPGFCEETWPREGAVGSPCSHSAARRAAAPADGAGPAAPRLLPAAPDPAQVAGAVDRYLALREFRARLYGCLTARPDACFELCDAILCADHAVTSLVQLSLVPEFRRGHGALYDALAAGQVDEEALAALLTGTLPQLIDGQEARPGSASTTRSTTACWNRPWPAYRPRRPRRSGRRARGGGGCGSRSTPPLIPAPMPSAPRIAAMSIMMPAAATAPARPSPAGSTSSSRRWGTCAPPGPRWSMSSAPRPPPARSRPRGRSRTCCAACTRPAPACGAPLVIMDAGYSAAALTAALAGQPVHLLIRLASRQRVLRQPRHLARQDRPPRQARHAGHLPQRPRPGQSRTG